MCKCSIANKEGEAMIISASRRTDIPTFYSEWFYNRIKEQYVLVRNPMNIHQISSISLSPDVVDCIVFWTKNPKPMFEKLDQLKDYTYYFQFTINSYGKNIETNVPSKKDEIIDTFRMLSDKIGPERVIWRYDPILINEKYSLEYHIEFFEKIAYHLRNYTEKCTISFIDFYSNIRRNLNEMGLHELSIDQMCIIAKNFSEIARSLDLKIDTCAEAIELKDFGIAHAKCIDDKLISRLLGENITVQKDKNQRLECGCVASIDIGLYNTCGNGCKYCYANHNLSVVRKNRDAYNPSSPLLCSDLLEDDKVSVRKVNTYRNDQLSFFK